MYLKRSITVNWGNLPAGELEYGPVNLLSGGNGSGKTTAADALQTLMTATYDNLFNYNPGQDETTQRGRGGKQVRTLASYILGCDDGAYARPQVCDGYIAGVFHPTKGESAAPFTAVIGVRAHLDQAGSSRQARQSELLMLIVPDEMLSLSHFVQHHPDGQRVVALTDLADALRHRFGKKGVEVYDKKGMYLARLYGALRGKRDAVSQQEARNAARSFARFMAYKPVESIDQFVAGEVLEPHDMGDTIRRIRDLLRTVHGMAEEAAQLQQNVALLSQAQQLANRYQENWLERLTLAYGAAAQQFRHNHRQYLAKKEEQTLLRQQQHSNLDAAGQVQQQLEQAHHELVELQARILGIPALRNKQQLEARRETLTAQLRQGSGPLLQQQLQRDRNLQALRNIRDILARHSLELELPVLAGKTWRSTSKELLAREQQPLPDLTQLLARDWIDLSPLEAQLEQVRNEQQLHNQLATHLHGAPEDLGGQQGPSLLQTLERLVATRGQALEELDRQRKRTEQQIRNLESRQTNYPPDVQEALKAIRQHCPQADPRVLCDHVEVQDPDWQMAIEGYIGGNRFGILVEPEYEAEAIRIVRRLPGRQQKAKVIQGEQARRDAENMPLPPDSIFHVLRFSHRTAEHYLKASYGSVVRVRDADTLRLTRRGVTVDGMGSGNYALFRCDIDDDLLVFGEAARQRSLRAQQATLLNLQTSYHHASASYQAVKQLRDQVTQFQPLQWVASVSHLLDAQRQLYETEAALANLDLSDHAALEQKQREARERHQQLAARKDLLKEEAGKLEEKLAACGRVITHLADQGEQLQDAKTQAEAELHACTRHWPGLAIEPRIDAMDQRLMLTHDDIDFAAGQRTLTEQLDTDVVTLHRILDSYNQQAQLADQLLIDSVEKLHSPGFFGHIHTLALQLDNLHNRLRNNVLLEKQEQLASLRDTFNTTFVSDLCSEIHQAIKDGERVLKSLNSELEHHCFGTDRERFSFEWEWLPEYKEYWSFFREVLEIPNLGDGASLFADDALSEKATAVRDRLLALLLDGDEQQALRELERIGDYRRYRRYDILKHPENKAPISLSQYGTGSGGQLETPAYIIRAAAITSAFRFNEGDSHLRMVIVDEAFMHMDESRSKSVIDYLTRTLGLQLIFIMPTSKAGPFLDLVSNQFVFSKVPSAVPIGELNTRVLVDRQQFNQERIRELWEQHRRVIRQQGALDFMEDIQ